MEAKNKKLVLICLEVLLLAATTYFLHVLLGIKTIVRWVELYIYVSFPNGMVIGLILAANIIWFVVATKLSFFNVYIKIIVTWLLIILSGYMVYSLLLLNAYSGMR